jgi:hypothetical protein
MKTSVNRIKSRLWEWKKYSEVFWSHNKIEKISMKLKIIKYEVHLILKKYRT